MDGLLLVDKPEGPTSHDMVTHVRQALGIRRVGHAGTLDPFASGLLLMLVGRATRLAQFLVGLPKEYTGVIELGAATDTEDRSGAVVTTSDTWQTISDNTLAAAARTLTGKYEQRPPAFSAKKVGGERAYKLAREGRAPTLSAVLVDVKRFDLGERVGPRVPFSTQVTSGTYVRALARDLGERLGCGAHLHALRRIAIGEFRVENALTPEQLPDARAALLAPLEAVRHLPQLSLDDVGRERIAHGQPVEGPPTTGGPVALVANAELVAVADAHNGLMKPRVVLVG